ncbi:MAG: tRNA (adenosine(37)-N6)-threonylcarbamoyltransferase complex ATPase subunit type 1 TsaE [Thermoanaerobaculia bacterium]
MTDERICPDEDATRRVGRELAGRLSPGDVVLLFGALGSGKTVFVRGLAEGLGLDPSEVASPSFALVHDYGPAGRPPVLLHADLYRLPDGTGLSELGLAERGGAILAVEWPRPPLVEMRAFRVTIEEIPGGARKIRIEAP